jgi:hypothetical protein
MKGILPETIRTRTKKIGFAALDEGWMSSRAQEFIRDSIDTIEFKTSPFWNGFLISTEMKTAFQEQDRDRIHLAWKFLQAMYLMKAFRSKSERS